MPWIDVGTLVSGGPGGVAWVDITGKPAVIAAGADAAAARAAIGAGTSNLVLGTTTGSALPGDSTPATIGAATAAQGVPTGGTTGQVLSKTTGTDYDTGWTTMATAAQGAKADTAVQPGGSTPIRNTWGVTQAEYDALTPPDPNTLYVITDSGA